MGKQHPRGTNRIQKDAKGKIKSPSENISSSITDNNTEYVLFSLRYIQPNYCISRCSKEDRIDFVEAMLKRREMTWNELHTADRRRLGLEKIKGKIKPSIPSCVKDNPIYAIRFSGDKRPMLGFRDKNIFYILWFEKCYGDIYDHG